MVDVELLAELLLGAKGTTDLSHRVVAIIQTLRHTVVRIILAGRGFLY